MENCPTFFEFCINYAVRIGDKAMTVYKERFNSAKRNISHFIRDQLCWFRAFGPGPFYDQFEPKPKKN